MIFDFSNIGFEDDEWLYMVERYLKGWTETPLTISGGYSIETLKFYDGFLGTLLKHTERLSKEYYPFGSSFCELLEISR